MKKHEKIDAFFDIVVLAMLIFTVMITVTDPIIRYLLVIVGCGSMFNNVKYVIKKSRKKKAKDKKKKEENK